MKTPIWLSKAAVLALHDELLAEHGGAAGIRDETLLDSALGKPHNIFVYGRPNLFVLATAYISGIVRNHPLVDGNKRTAFVAGAIFLERNGKALTAPEKEATDFMLALAGNTISENEFAIWLQKHCD